VWLLIYGDVASSILTAANWLRGTFLPKVPMLKRLDKLFLCSDCFLLLNNIVLKVLDTLEWVVLGSSGVVVRRKSRWWWEVTMVLGGIEFNLLYLSPEGPGILES